MCGVPLGSPKWQPGPSRSQEKPQTDACCGMTTCRGCHALHWHEMLATSSLLCLLPERLLMWHLCIPFCGSLAISLARLSPRLSGSSFRIRLSVFGFRFWLLSFHRLQIPSKMCCGSTKYKTHPRNFSRRLFWQRGEEKSC